MRVRRSRVALILVSLVLGPLSLARTAAAPVGASHDCDETECIVVRPPAPAVGLVAAAEALPATPGPGSGFVHVVLLVFDGANVDVRGTGFEPFDTDDGIVPVPTFADSLAAGYPALDPVETKREIFARIRDDLAPFFVLVTDNEAVAIDAGGGSYERLYVGGSHTMFGNPMSIGSSTLGIAELDNDDDGNRNLSRNSIGFLLVEHFRNKLSDGNIAGELMGVVGAHEVGHMFGLNHVGNPEARMNARVTLNTAEIFETWRAGIVQGSLTAYQDSNLMLGESLGLSEDPFPSDPMPDDRPDHFFAALDALDVDDPFVAGPLTIDGRVEIDGDVDVITFTPAQSGVVTATVRPTSSFNPVLAVVDLDAQLVGARDVAISGNQEELTFDVDAGVTYFVYVNGSHGTSRGTYEILLCAVPAEPPTVVETRINGGDPQRSRVDTVEAIFNTDVEVDLSGVALVSLGVNAPEDPDQPVDLDPTAVAYDADRRTLVLDVGPSLPDGFYELRIDPAAVRDCQDRILNDDGSGIAGPDYTFVFHRFAGDIDGDADVDLADYLAFQACFQGSGAVVADECGPADLDFDGDVDLADLLIMQGVFVGSVAHVGPD